MSINLTVDSLFPTQETLRQAVDVLGRGEIVAVPTDTFYGLAVDPRNTDAVRTLFQAKGRGEEIPIPLIASDVDQIELEVGSMSVLAHRLADCFWPGPLTVIVEAKPSLAKEIHLGTSGVAVRVPKNSVAKKLMCEARYPLTATSANRSGGVAARTAEEVISEIGEQVALILDAGPVPGGLPSTIVDTRTNHPRLIREGAVPWERVLESLG